MGRKDTSPVRISNHVMARVREISRDMGMKHQAFIEKAVTSYCDRIDVEGGNVIRAPKKGDDATKHHHAPAASRIGLAAGSSAFVSRGHDLRG